MLETICIILAILFLWIARETRKARAIIPHRDEWLEVLDAQEWRTDETIHELMQELKGTTTDLFLVLYGDLEDLHEEGMIEVRPNFRDVEYQSGVPGSGYRLSGNRSRGGPNKRRRGVASLLGIFEPVSLPA